MYKKTLFSILLTWIVLAPAAHALGIKLEGAANFSTAVDNMAGGYDHPAKLGIGGGAEASFGFGGNWSFDAGLLYLQRKYGTDIPGSSVSFTTTQTGIEVPVLVRYWPVHVFSVGLGGYYMKYLGNLNYEVTLNGVTGNTTSTYAAANQTTSDYGLVASIGIDIPIGLMTGLVVDARYEHGLKNNFPSGDVKFRDFTGIVGVRFGSAH